MRKRLAWLFWFFGAGVFVWFLGPYIREGDMIVVGLIGGAPFLFWAASALPCLHRRLIQRVLFYMGLLLWLLLFSVWRDAFPAAGAYDYFVWTAAGLVLFSVAGILARKQGAPAASSVP